MHPLEYNEAVSEASPSLRLYFFRHDEKGNNTDGTDEGDYRVALTEAGRLNAQQVGRDKAGHGAPRLAFGSPRDRSLETALLHAYPDIAEAAVLEDIKKKIRDVLPNVLRLPERAQKPTSKVQNWTQIENLNFNFGATGGPMRELYDQHYLRDKDLLHYIYNDSDADLLRTGDHSAASYSLYAAGVAKEVLRATKVLGHMVRHDPERKGLLQNRFYGSHQSVTECFLLKVLEKTQGKEAAIAFLGTLKGKQGFEFSEGFSIDIRQEDGIPIYTLTFREQQVSFSQERVHEIIDEGEQLAESIRSQKDQ